MADLPANPLKPNGKKPPRIVIAGIVIGGGLLAFWWWKNSNATAAATATDPNAIDPLTGLPYSAETGANLGPLGISSDTGSSSTGGVTDSNGSTITNNAAWTQDVETRLGAIMDPGAVLAAIGKYLSRIPLTSAEADIVRQAWALDGYPPNGPDTYTLVTSTSAPGGGTTPPPPVKVVVPPPVRVVTPPPVKAPPKPPPPKKYTKYVTVVKFTTKNPPWNSTLSGIAGHTGVSVATLQKINKISNPDLIHVGQKIYYASGAVMAAKNVSREAALGLGLGSAALVWTVYNGICPSVSDTKASAPSDSILFGSERTAAFISAGLVGGIALIAKDPTVFVIGGVALLALSWAHRHANIFDPMAPGNGMLPSPSNLQEAVESPGYVPA